MSKKPVFYISISYDNNINAVKKIYRTINKVYISVIITKKPIGRRTTFPAADPPIISTSYLKQS